MPFSHIYKKNNKWRFGQAITPQELNAISDTLEQVTTVLTNTNSLNNIKDGTGTGSIIEGLLNLTPDTYTEEQDANANIANGNYAHAEGFSTTASGEISHAEGAYTSSIGKSSHAEGKSTISNGESSHVEGELSGSAGKWSHAEGYRSHTYGDAAHAQGYNTSAHNTGAHAEGSGASASGVGAHAQGYQSQANKEGSHAEGYSTHATKMGAHAEGILSTASGPYSHAEGLNTEASAESSHAEGNTTKANKKAQHVFGRFNVAEDGTTNDYGTYVEIVGNGTSTTQCSNARTLDWQGNEVLAGGITLGKGTDTEINITPTLAQTIMSSVEDTNMLKNSILDLTSLNSTGIDFIHDTYTGETQINIYKNLPSGEYNLTIDSIVSDDTDASTCQLLFTNRNASTTVLVLLLSRDTLINNTITLTSDVERVILYASNSYPHSMGDTFTFNNIQISSSSKLVNAINKLSNDIQQFKNDNREIVFSGELFQGTQSLRVNTHIDPGEYILHCGPTISSDTDSSWSGIWFGKGNTDEVTITFPRDEVSKYIKFNNEVTDIVFWASDTFFKGVNDTFKFQNVWIEKINSLPETLKLPETSTLYTFTGSTVSNQDIRYNHHILPGSKIEIKSSTTDNQSGVLQVRCYMPDNPDYYRQHGWDMSINSTYSFIAQAEYTAIIFRTVQSYNNVKIDITINDVFSAHTRLCALEQRFQEEESSAYIIKNKNYSGTTLLEIPQQFPKGDYLISVENITSNDTDTDSCLVLFTSNDANVERARVLLERGVSQTYQIYIPADTHKMFLFASSTGYSDSRNDQFKYTNLTIQKYDTTSNRTPILTPLGFEWTTHPLFGHLFRSERGIECDFDITNYKPVANSTVWVSPSGDDSFTGIDSVHPLKSLKTALNRKNVDTIIVEDGFYTISMAPQEINTLDHSVAILAAENAHPVISTNAGPHTFAKLGEYSYVYSVKVNSNCVWDIPNARPLSYVGSIALVNSTPSSYFTDGTYTYVHTKDGSAPTNNIRCCPQAENCKLITEGRITVYLEGLTFCGGNQGAFHACNSVANIRPRIYGKDCIFVGAVGGGACFLEGCESIMQGCEACESVNDGFGIHRNNTKVHTSPYAIEINCQGHHNGRPAQGGYLTKNGSTSHAGAKVIRVNSSYHHNYGPNVGDVHNNTQSWNLGCQAYCSTVGTDQRNNVDYIISDGTTPKMWLDTCTGYGSLHSLVVVGEPNGNVQAFVKNSVLSNVVVEGTGTLIAY